MDLARETGGDAARATVTPYDQADWEAKLRAARAKRHEVLEQRGVSDRPAPLIRPDARPPFSPPAGEPPPGCDPRMAPVAPEKRWFDPDAAPGKPAPRQPNLSDPAPVETAPAAPRSQPMAMALRRISDQVPKMGAPRAGTPGDRTGAHQNRDKRPGTQVLAAFALGLGVGVPLASVAWLLVDQSSGPAIVASADLRPAALDGPAPVVSQAGPEGATEAAPQDTGAKTLGEALPAQPTPPSSIAGTTPPVPGFPSGPTDSVVTPVPVLAEGTADSATTLLAGDEPRGSEQDGTAGDAAIQMALADALGQSPEPPAAAPLDIAVADPSSAGTAASDHTGAVATLVPVIRPTSRPFRAAPETPFAIVAGPMPDGSVVGQDSEVRIYAPSRVPSSQMSAIAADLRQSGANVVDPVRTRLTIQDTHVRYYHASDAAEARAIAARVGAEARDFTSFSPSPPEGMLELWVSGRGTSAPTRSTRPNDPVAAVARDLGGALSRLLSSIPPSDPQH
ncbi:MAG: hypothetical protein AAGC86_05920 [Pseudomonadota bacterium]